MNVLVLGGGGREHALAWRIQKDPGVSQVFLHPGNPGTWNELPSLEDTPMQIESVAEAARARGVSLIVIGPEVLLAQGYADALRKHGFLVVGPAQQAARLETSKAFAKEFLVQAGIPTALYKKANSPDGVRQVVGNRFPIVLKLDALAAGKGVVIAQNAADMEDFIEKVWERREFGLGDFTVVVEDYLEGKEISYIGLCDGNHFIPLPSASDYKRLGDGNTGPNTGGMGAVSPSPFLTPALEEEIRTRVVQPTLAEMRKQKMDYRGALYFGLLISNGTPYVLEFNARFGDPETQAQMLRVSDGFTQWLVATAKGELKTMPALVAQQQTALYVVACAQGYPSKPRGGDTISGLDALSPEIQTFFSGVSGTPRSLSTSGGRVLGLGCLAANLPDCRQRVYAGLKRLHWPGIHYRRDIGVFS